MSALVAAKVNEGLDTLGSRFVFVTTFMTRAEIETLETEARALQALQDTTALKVEQVKSYRAAVLKIVQTLNRALADAYENAEARMALTGLLNATKIMVQSLDRVSLVLPKKQVDIIPVTPMQNLAPVSKDVRQNAKMFEGLVRQQGNNAALSATTRQQLRQGLRQIQAAQVVPSAVAAVKVRVMTPRHVSPVAIRATSTITQTPKTKTPIVTVSDSPSKVRQHRDYKSVLVADTSKVAPVHATTIGVVPVIAPIAQPAHAVPITSVSASRLQVNTSHGPRVPAGVSVPVAAAPVMMDIKPVGGTLDVKIDPVVPTVVMPVSRVEVMAAPNVTEVKSAPVAAVVTQLVQPIALTQPVLQGVASVAAVEIKNETLKSAPQTIGQEKVAETFIVQKGSADPVVLTLEEKKQDITGGKFDSKIEEPKFRDEQEPSHKEDHKDRYENKRGDRREEERYDVRHNDPEIKRYEPYISPIVMGEPFKALEAWKLDEPKKVVTTILRKFGLAAKGACANCTTGDCGTCGAAARPVTVDTKAINNRFSGLKKG